MLRKPSGKSKKKTEGKLNLVPILDGIFIIVFFILISSNFTKINEINSNVPMVSSKPPEKKEKKDPLALTLEIEKDKLTLRSGVPGKVLTTFTKINGEFPYASLHSYLIDIKKKNMDEKTIIFEPSEDIEYETIVKIMDTVRSLSNMDETLFANDEQGIPVKLELLFEDIIFGNITT